MTDTPTPEPDWESETPVTWQPKRGVGFRVVAWLILAGFVAFVLIAAAVMVEHFWKMGRQ